jgi:membrane associated rhomboid family serine protease
MNVLVFSLELLVPSAALDGLVETWGLVPYRLASGDPLAVLSLFTSMFLHGGFVHLLGNLLYLWIFGDNVEGALGSSRYLLFYVLCGLGAAAGQIVIDPLSRVPMVGASGAISGVLGAYLLLFPQVTVETLVFVGYFVRLVRLPAVMVLGLWMITQLLSGVLSLGMEATGGVAWFAHIGGAISGVVLVSLLKPRRWWE